jgi:hypothetical protein
LALDCTARTLKPDLLGVGYLARQAQQQACQKEAKGGNEQCIVTIVEHGYDYKGFFRGVQAWDQAGNPQ